MGKRGLSHVEAIVSFVLFVGFLFLAFYFFSPFQGTNRVLDSSLDYALSEIMNNASLQTETYELSIDSGILSPIVIITINNVLENVNATVFNYEGEILNSRLIGNDIAFSRGLNENFIRIIFSEGITETSGLGGIGIRLPPGNYTISSSEIEEVVSEKLLLELNSSYYSQYDSLKQSFNIPNRVDFAFEVMFEDGEKITAERDVPVELEVVAKKERMEIIRTDGRVEFADLTVRVW